MQSSYSTPSILSNPPPRRLRATESIRAREQAVRENPAWIQPPFAELQADDEREHLQEVARLSDIGFIFLLASNGNTAQAEKLLDDLIELVFESGVLSMWRYRILLTQIREGL